MNTLEDVIKTFEHNGKFSPGLSETKKYLVQALSNSFKELAKEIVLDVPDSKVRSEALASLLEAKWACMVAIEKPNYIGPKEKGKKNDK